MKKKIFKKTFVALCQIHCQIHCRIQYDIVEMSYWRQIWTLYIYEMGDGTYFECTIQEGR